MKAGDTFGVGAAVGDASGAFGGVAADYAVGMTAAAAAVEQPHCSSFAASWQAKTQVPEAWTEVRRMPSSWGAHTMPSSLGAHTMPFCVSCPQTVVPLGC